MQSFINKDLIRKSATCILSPTWLEVASYCRASPQSASLLYARGKLMQLCWGYRREVVTVELAARLGVLFTVCLLPCYDTQRCLIHLN